MKKLERLEQIVQDTDNAINFLEILIDSCGIKDRSIVQAYCIWKFKYELGIEIGRNPGIEYAGNEWVERKLASRFAQVYDERLDIHTIYQRTVHPESYYLR